MLSRIIFLAFLAVVIVCAGCKKNNPTSPPIPQVIDGLWTVYTPFNWPHDGQPYTSTFCVVYSDGASYEMKQQMAAIADTRFRQILHLFNIRDLSGFIYPSGNSKIEIYINRHHPENIAWAYWGGFIITIRSSAIIGHYYDYAVYTARHELTHDLEFLIEGREVLRSEVWFKEGIAVRVGCIESTGWQTIDNLSELELWITQNQNVPGQGNPIKIHLHGDFPPGADRHRYYQFFELAVRYLLDPRGMGKSFQDVKWLFYDMREGRSFPAAFQEHFGISVGDYEREFYDRMRIYLGSVP